MMIYIEIKVCKEIEGDNIQMVEVESVLDKLRVSIIGVTLC